MKTYSLIIAFSISIMLIYNGCHLHTIETNTLNSPRFLVTDKDSLLKSLGVATRGDTLFFKNGIEIDLTNLANIRIPGGVSLVGTTVNNDNFRDYPLLFTHSVPGLARIEPLFLADGDDIYISGLRFRGTTSETGEYDAAQLPGSVGVSSNGHNRIIIENCEFYYWRFSAILFDGDSRDNHVRNNYIHHNRQAGLGYGVTIGQGSYAAIEHNRFDYNRHDISGNGLPGSGYTARFNRIGRNGTSHSFDMHGGADRNDNTDIAGCCIIIENNEFFMRNHWAIAIRGIPEQHAIIKNNTFHGERNHVRNAAVKQVNSYGNIFVGPNQFSFDFTEITEPGWVVIWGKYFAAELLITTRYSFDNVRVGDFNGDEISDILVVERDGSWNVSWSALTPWQQHNNKLPERYPVESLFLGDFRGDGITDILLVNNGKWHLSAGGSQYPKIVNEVPEAEVSSIVIADIDGNGIDDVIFRMGKGWFFSKEGSHAPEVLRLLGPEITSLTSIDFAGDKREELMFTVDNVLFAYQSETNSYQKITELKGKFGLFHAADFNGDGKVDVFCADGQDWYLYNTVSKQWSKLLSSALLVDDLLFADFNGDGVTDIVVKSRDYHLVNHD
jgi:hypothetical protein